MPGCSLLALPSKADNNPARFLADSRLVRVTFPANVKGEALKLGLLETSFKFARGGFWQGHCLMLFASQTTLIKVASHLDFQHRSQHRQQSTAQPCAHKYHKYPQSELSEASILSWNQNCRSAAMEDETQTRRTTTWDDEVSEKPNIPLVWQKETSGCIMRSSQSKEVSSQEKKRNTISICECHNFNFSLGWFNIICSYIYIHIYSHVCPIVVLCIIMLLYVSICQLSSTKAPHPSWSFKTYASSAAPAWGWKVCGLAKKHRKTLERSWKTLHFLRLSDTIRYYQILSDTIRYYQILQASTSIWNDFAFHACELFELDTWDALKAKRPANETMCDVLQASANWSMVVRVSNSGHHSKGQPVMIVFL